MGSLAKSTGGQNRRGKGRKRVLIAGKIVSGGGATSLSCTILDISDGGCQIRFSKTVELPQQFHLIEIPNRRVHRVTVAWSKPPLAGLRCDESHALDASLPRDLDYLRKIWIESATR